MTLISTTQEDKLETDYKNYQPFIACTSIFQTNEGWENPSQTVADNNPGIH